MPTYEVTDSQTGRTFELTGDSPPTQAELLQLFSNLPAENLVGREGNPAAIESVLKSTPPLLNDAFRKDFPDLSRNINSFLINMGVNRNDSVRGLQQRNAETPLDDRRQKQLDSRLEQFRSKMVDTGVQPEEADRIISSVKLGSDIESLMKSEAESQALGNEAARQAPVGGISGMATALIGGDPVNYIGLGMIDKVIRAPQITTKVGKVAAGIAAGMATGYTAGQTAYLDEEIPLTRGEFTGITTLVGGTIPPALLGGARVFNNWGKKKQLVELGHRLTNYENTYNLSLIKTGSKRKAAADARKVTGFRAKDLEYVSAMTESALPKLGKNPLDAAQKLATNPHMNSILPTDMVDDLMSKDITRVRAWTDKVDPLFGIGGDTAKKRMGRLAGRGPKDKGVLDELDFYVGSIKTRLKNYSPDMADALTRMDFNVSVMANEWTQAGQPFFNAFDDWAKTADKNVFDEFVSRMYTNRDDALAYLSRIPNTKKLITLSKPMFKALDDIADSGASIDGFVGKLEGYFPRRPSMDKTTRPLIYQDAEDALSRKFAAVQGNNKETAKLMNAVVETPTKVTASGSTMGHRRAIRTVKPYQLPAYAGLRASYDSAVNDAARVIGRKQFFDTIGAADPFVKMTGETLDTASIVKALEKQPLDPNDAQAVAEILQARFGPGEQGVSRMVGNLKDLSHIILLGDIKSSMTQLGDLYANMHRNGVWNAFIGTAKALRMGSLSKEDVLGLHNMVIDMAGTTRLHKIADNVLTGTGFRKVDNFGKTAQMEAALLKWRKRAVGDAARLAKGRTARRTGGTGLVGETFDERWGGLFNTPESLQQLKDDLVTLHNFKGKMKDRPITDNIGLMLWDELSSVQPISISDMPEAWARGNRLPYTLQSFTLKQLDIMRNDIYNNLAQGTMKTPEGRRALARAAKSLITYSTFFTGTQAGVDRMKEHFTSALTGKEVEDWGDTLQNAALKGIGLNKYTSDQFLQDGDIWSLIASFMGAGLAAPGIPFEAAMKGEPEQLLEGIPLIGRTLRDYFSEQRKEAEKSASNISGMNEEDSKLLEGLFPNDNINELF